MVRMDDPGFQFEFEPVPACPLCGAGNRTTRLNAPMIGGGTAALAKCPECGLVFLDPAPSSRSIERFYEEIYFTPGYRALEGFAVPDPVQELAVTLQYMERLADSVEEFRLPPGRLLDVGAAYGGFLMEMQSRGWDTCGVEPSGQAAAFCRERLGLNVLHAGIGDAELPAAAFAAVTLWDVIEHFAQPVQALRRITELTAPGSLLALTTPNADSPAALIGRENWIGWKPPTHLCIFNFHSMRQLLETCGWKILRAHGGGVYPGQITVFAEKQ